MIMSKDELIQRIRELEEEYKTLSLGDWQRPRTMDRICVLRQMLSWL